MASFDTASKKQVETNPQDFVDLCFKFGNGNVSVLEVVTPEQPTVEMHQADILIKALSDDTEVLVHFEFQTSDSFDPEMPLRMAGYIIRAIETYRLPVYSNVIYLRPDSMRKDPGIFIQDLENHRISIEYQVFRLIEIDGQQILDLKPVGLVPFTPLMKRPKGMNSAQWFRQCIQVADSIDVANKPEYLASLVILGNLVYDSQTMIDIISEETMHQSSVVEYVAPEARKQGIEQGIEQGAQQMARENILELLNNRLETVDVKDLESALSKISDLNQLKELFQIAMQVENLDDFKKALEENQE
ncbi:hypothetical protein JT359_00405 [Candidatus Poribacteria bacterium]|nr:hypothetical protein [Candidatus Poribacteria bacterium]